MVHQTTKGSIRKNNNAISKWKVKNKWRASTSKPSNTSQTKVMTTNSSNNSTLTMRCTMSTSKWMDKLILPNNYMPYPTITKAKYPTTITIRTITKLTLLLHWRRTNTIILEQKTLPKSTKKSMIMLSPSGICHSNKASLLILKEMHAVLCSFPKLVRERLFKISIKFSLQQSPLTSILLKINILLRKHRSPISFMAKKKTRVNNSSKQMGIERIRLKS